MSRSTRLERPGVASYNGSASTPYFQEFRMYSSPTTHWFEWSFRGKRARSEGMKQSKTCTMVLELVKVKSYDGMFVASMEVCCYRNMGDTVVAQ